MIMESKTYFRNACLSTAIVLVCWRCTSAEDVDALLQQAVLKALDHVAPSVVTIETAGGMDRVGRILKGQGPTTGVVIGPGGYIITSSFNFVHKPASILVKLPDGKRYAAEHVATDHVRMVTLIKIDARGLPVPEYATKEKLRTGQRCIAIGKAFGDESPSVSVGIISALNRVWGKAVQTDAKVSPINYGGPLVDLYGRVIGILVPLSPMREGETAGFEWYDSGIGFAVYFQDVLGNLERLKKGKDLKRGLLGIRIAGGMYKSKVSVQEVPYRSPAARAGLKPKDIILQIDGAKIRHQADLRFTMATKYAGDTVKLKVRRGDQELVLQCRLADKMPPYERPMLGILPVRSAPQNGVYVRYVFPGSAADRAGIRPGDCITRFNKAAPKTPGQLALQVWRSQPEQTADIQLKRGNETLSVRATLQLYTPDVPKELPPDQPITVAKEKPDGKKPGAPSKTSAEKTDKKKQVGNDESDKKKNHGQKKAPDASPRDVKKAQKQQKQVSKEGKVEKVPAAKEQAQSKPKPKPKTGLIKKTIDKYSRSYWAYVPSTYTPQRPIGLIIWLHPKGATLEKAVMSAWRTHAEKRGIGVLGIRAGNGKTWVNADIAFVFAAIGDFHKDYRVDSARIIIHGLKEGADLAAKLCNQQRGLFRGIAVAGISRPMKVSPTQPNLPFFALFLSTGSAGSSTAESKSASDLSKARHPLIIKRAARAPGGYLSSSDVLFMALWLDSLDRI